MSKYQPFVLLGPGDTIREELEYYDWTQEDLASITGLSKKHISQLVSNKVPITFDTARILSEVFGQSPQFWLNADARYRVALEQSAPHEETKARALIYRYMPVRDMRKKGLLPKETERLLEAVLRFWRMNALEFDFMEKRAACFRKSRAQRQFNPYFALTWLQVAKNCVQEEQYDSRIAAFDAERLWALGDSLPGYTTSSDGVAEFLDELSRCGVVFLHVPHLEKTYADGATFWHGDVPVLVYTCRFDRNDNFWFTVAHEMGHILHHQDNDRPVFIDNLDDLDLEDEREGEADEFARQHLRIPEIRRAFQDVQRVSRAKVLKYSAILGVHPAVIVGALQHADKLGYQALNDLKEPVRDVLESRTSTNVP